MSAIDGANKRFKSFIRVSLSTWFTFNRLIAQFNIGHMENNGNLKMIMVDLIEEDFTSRAFDNIKSLNSLAKEVL